jgi:pyruvate/2-oxoglutarate dehydrogenase complex dihydrolipoamide acyltransferase (E2) component
MGGFFTSGTFLDPVDAFGINKKIFGEGDGKLGSGMQGDILAIKAAQEAAAAAAGPAPNPFRRPKPTPDTAEGEKTDRRRSIAAAMRRRAQSSILTSNLSGDTLGT